MFAAVAEHKLHFSLLHREDESPIGYAKVCKLEEKPVPEDEIVKAYEIEKGEFVYVEDEDFEAARAEGGHAFDIEQFVPIEDIDPLYFEHSYYLGPQDGAEKVYMLLVKAMEDAGLAAVGTFVMRDREYLGCLRIHDGVITLERMYFADEIRPPEDLRPKGARVSKEELEMAASLVDRFRGDFDPKKYKDTYRDDLMAVIEAKRKGKAVHVGAEVEEKDEAPDLLTALRESVERSSGSAKRGKRTQARKRAPAKKRTQTRRAA